MKIYTLIVILIIWAGVGQVPAQPVTHQKIDKEMVAFFQGSRTGESRFANGRPIAARASFEVSLDSCWLRYSHTDQPPNIYKAIGMWGLNEAKDTCLAYLFDNFGGVREFKGPTWDGSQLALQYQTTIKGSFSFQRFTFTRLDKNRFKMEYSVSRDSIRWNLGDLLIFSQEQ